MKYMYFFSFSHSTGFGNTMLTLDHKINDQTVYNDLVDIQSQISKRLNCTITILFFTFVPFPGSGPF